MLFAKDHDKIEEIDRLDAIYEQYMGHTRLPGALTNKEKLGYLNRMRSVGLLTEHELNFYIKEKNLEKDN